MASRGALKVLMRSAGQRSTALSPSSSLIQLRSGGGGRNQYGNQEDIESVGGVRWANLKLIANRMKSVSSISKITKAMKMVAASKLRGVQGIQENSRPFARGMQDFFKIIDEAENKVGEEGAEAKKNAFVVAITSDKGLCGGVNSFIVKEVKKMIAEDPGTNYSILLVGDKGRDGLSRAHGNEIAVSFKDVFKTPVSFSQVCLIAEDILSRNFEQIILVYNKFKSVISQEVTRTPIVGLDVLMASAEAFHDYEFDSDMDSAQVLVDLFEFQLATQIYNALLENSTSEQASRMSAMENASKNAGEMLQSLTLSYNRQRQAAITQELSEITSGAAALE
eukprot:Plantae.Rhodophyta-Hildenbrandia_rubra.ctg9744.p2 GENE.Plantae.Rhodophyta-Hildenbrandia_rubra.ctg9744~~Plantae.Rhodophyta-Hildenbrandia_rubra.ctg9744.p2  ORF type:complete len:336 (-),score=80.71 Plantae.Rhodophyta-Hildenbrandia_rubra.ctg9744:2999-4006(-)